MDDNKDNKVSANTDVFFIVLGVLFTILLSMTGGIVELLSTCSMKTFAYQHTFIMFIIYFLTIYVFINEVHTDKTWYQKIYVSAFALVYVIIFMKGNLYLQLCIVILVYILYKIKDDNLLSPVKQKYVEYFIYGITVISFIIYVGEKALKVGKNNFSWKLFMQPTVKCSNTIGVPSLAKFKEGVYVLVRSLTY